MYGVSWVHRIPASTWLFSIAVLAAAVSIIEIVDWIELPFESLFTSAPSSFFVFTRLVPLVASMGYVGLFVLMFLENMALPIPSELVLPLAGYMILIGRMNFPFALVVSSIASLLGSLAIYVISLMLSPPLIYALANKFGVSQGRLAKSEIWLSGKYGSALILIARFIPGIRSSISIPAGVLKMNLLRFSIMTLIGSFGWSVLLMYMGYSAGGFATGISNLLFKVAPYAITIFSLGYIAYFIRFRTQKRTEQMILK